MNHRTMNSRALRFALVIAGLCMPFTPAMGQSTDDSVAVFRALAQRWQEQAPGKRLGLVTAFAPKDGSQYELPAAAEAHRQKEKIAGIAGSRFELLDPVALGASADVQRGWTNAVKHLWKHYAYGPLTISGDKATIDVYEAQPYKSKADNADHVDQLYVRYCLTRASAGWSITSVEPLHATSFTLPAT